MKDMLKLKVLTMLILFAFITKAQQPPNFKAEEAVGIFTYDTEKVIKKLKVEDTETEKSIRITIEEYNQKMYELSETHAATFKELDDYFDRQVQVAMQRRDRSQMDGVKSKIRETIPPIRQEVMEHETQLNNTMKGYLDERQYKKWINYQKAQRPSGSVGMGVN